MIDIQMETEAMTRLGIWLLSVAWIMLYIPLTAMIGFIHGINMLVGRGKVDTEVDILIQVRDHVTNELLNSMEGSNE